LKLGVWNTRRIERNAQGVTMKKFTLDQWEKKYITGPVERFDQKYTMFNRPIWDPDIQERLKNWSSPREIRDKAGYTLQDYALITGSDQGTRMTLFNTSKPNPNRISKAVAAAIGDWRPLTQARVAADEPPQKVKIDVSDPQKITRDIKKAAAYFGADLVGICKLDKRWVYSNSYERPGPDEAASGSKSQEIPEEFQYAIVMGFEEDYDLIKYYPTALAGTATRMGYSRMAITCAYLSEFIRSLGFEAINCSNNDVTLSVPMAMQAGLGDLGRHGLLITPRFGPRLRLDKIITNMPLVVDAPIDFGVTEFCETCMKCADRCPSRSISSGERTTKPLNVSNVADELKWYVDGETCRMYWVRSGPCTACIACCPYNKPDTLFHRVAGWSVDHMRWADSFYVKMDDLFGYGKPKKADDFWQEWQPKRH